MSYKQFLIEIFHADGDGGYIDVGRITVEGLHELDALDMTYMAGTTSTGMLSGSLRLSTAEYEALGVRSLRIGDAAIVHGESGVQRYLGTPRGWEPRSATLTT